MKTEITMYAEKTTKNTIRFTEKLASDLDTPVIGTVYIPKPTLKAIGYTEGKQIIVTVDVK